MSDYGGGDGYDDEGGDENDWLYVEDYYDEADQLAEYTCPSPIYFEEGVYKDQDDMFDYFADISYLSDGGYYDDKDPDAPNRKRKADTKTSTAPNKRRRNTKAVVGRTKLSFEPVIWMSNAERETLLGKTGPVVTAAEIKPVGLLKDWREKFEDQSGLAQFPKEDFELRDVQDDEGFEDVDDEEIAGEGFDLSDLQQVAELLSGENMDALQQIMEARGMDPEAIKEVLKDLIDGKERTFEDESDGQVEDEEADGAERHEQGYEQGAREVMAAQPQQPTRGMRGDSAGARATGTQKAPKPQPNGHAAHRPSKRKAREDDDWQAADEAPGDERSRKKRNAPDVSSEAPRNDQTSSEQRYDPGGHGLSSPRRTRYGRVRE